MKPFRCGHPRTPANCAPSGDYSRCRQCRNARLARYMRTWRGGWPYTNLAWRDL